MGNENSSARLRSKMACMAFYRKRSNMRCAFVIFLAICFIAFSLDCRFVYSPRPGTLEEEGAHVPEQRLLIKPVCARIELKCYHDEILDIHFLTLS